MNPASGDRGDASGRIKPAAELSVQLLHRAYCYLRLSGLEPSSALAGMRTSFDALASAEAANAAEAVWAELQQLTARHVARAPSAPPLLRGHMGYP